MKNKRKYIKHFNPCVEIFDKKQHKDFLSKFDCGKYNFNIYISSNEVVEDMRSGDGVTHLVFDKPTFGRKKLVAYYTLIATSIPYNSKLLLEPEDVVDPANPYIELTYGVNAIQIKMFAVDKNYQDLFFKHGGFDMPISAWVFQSIIDSIDDISEQVCGVKAIILHAVADAEKFYLKNEFNYTEKHMEPFASDDDDLRTMFFKLREINIPSDD
nr:MAG TPA: hypothetical protein [Caudoviricetes sp.]